MSRSVRKVPGYNDRSPYAKRQANRRVRRAKGLSNGKMYKKCYSQWRICEQRCLLFYTEDGRWIRDTGQDAYKFFYK